MIPHEVNSDPPRNNCQVCGAWRCVDPTNHVFVVLVIQGAEQFCAKVNIEVQLASEGAIAAIERNGGVVTTSYYDPRSLSKQCDICCNT